MRLTADLIREAPSYINPLNDRELYLRGHRIPGIENMGVSKDQNDAIDLSENEIRQLGNFARLPRLRHLLLARNRISVIQSDLSTFLPNLTILVLSDNLLSQLVDLEPIGNFNRLVHLVLVNNPVTQADNYRLWVIWRNPTVRFLDFIKVKDSERVAGRKLFGQNDQQITPLAQRILGVKAKTFDVDQVGLSGGERIQHHHHELTESDRKRLQEELQKAVSIQDIEKIDRQLKQGYL